jgi:hypothetical protein
MTDLEAIRARHAKTTQGPWVAKITGVNCWVDSPTAQTWIGEARIAVFVGERRGPAKPKVDPQEAANAEFIAAAHQDIPALCDEIDRLRAELGR